MGAVQSFLLRQPLGWWTWRKCTAVLRPFNFSKRSWRWPVFYAVEFCSLHDGWPIFVRILSVCGTGGGHVWVAQCLQLHSATKRSALLDNLWLRCVGGNESSDDCLHFVCGSCCLLILKRSFYEAASRPGMCLQNDIWITRFGAIICAIKNETTKREPRGFVCLFHYRNLLRSRRVVIAF